MSAPTVTSEFLRAADMEPAVFTTPPGATVIGPDAKLYAEHVAHLRAEIDRLTADRDKQATQVRAEQEHNRRLAVACALYRSAAVRNGVPLRVIEEGGDPTQDVCESISNRSRADMDKADALVMPTAK